MPAAFCLWRRLLEVRTMLLVHLQDAACDTKRSLRLFDSIASNDT